MANKSMHWQERGYHLLLVEAKPRGSFNLLVSRDGESYAIYDRFHALNLEAARASIRFNPALYEAVPPPFPIAKERALAGETGIPPYMEPMVGYIEKMPFR